jgi:hypothetical protein
MCWYVAEMQLQQRGHAPSMSCSSSRRSSRRSLGDSGSRRAMSGGTLDRQRLIERAAAAAKFSQAEAQARITELADAQLLYVPDDELTPVKLTDVGQQLHTEIRAAVSQITQRLWGDLPVEDLEAAGRVLSTVLARANAELASA